MKLITELSEDLQYITEADEDGGKKNYYIEGVFMQSAVKNRNGRIYPTEILENEVGRYNKEYVAKNRAMGELNHPQGPTVNLDRVSHIIKELKVEGNNIMGKAKIMDTPMGKIAKNLIDEGAKLGVSSRGMGSLKQNKQGINEVQKDFMLAAVDIVADPSAPNAFVNGIMEGREWIWNNGVLEQRQIEAYKELVEKTPKIDIEKVTLKLFEDFMLKMRNV
ncbi:MAG: primosomal protein [Proteobacteria bacterium]|nr:primosomal protein [Pseudomonadota bacterium]